MTDDSRFINVNGRRWRRTDPSIPAALKTELVAARREVKRVKALDDEPALARARQRVHDAKLALGERGRAWWLPVEPEHQGLRIRSSIKSLLRKREGSATICPSDVARIVGGARWRDSMRDVVGQAWALVEEGWLEVVQGGRAVKPGARGPVRLRRVADDKDQSPDS